MLPNEIPVVLASRGDPVAAMERAIQRLATDQFGDTEHLHPNWPLEREYPLLSNLRVCSRLWRNGDGVLQLAAIGAADIRVAMGKRGSAVARKSTDLVLLQDTFIDLVAALELGWRVDANLHRALGYTLAIHLPIVALGLVPLLLTGQALIVLPVHIALLHLVIDPACTVVFEALPATTGLMRQPPRQPAGPAVGRPAEPPTHLNPPASAWLVTVLGRC